MASNLIQVIASNTTVSCKVVGAQKFTLNTTTTPFIGHYAFLPLDPIAPVDPCRPLGELSLDLQLNVNDQGLVTGARKGRPWR